MSSGSACWILWLTPMDWLALSIGRSGSQPLEYSIFTRPNYEKVYYPNKYLVSGHTPTPLIDENCKDGSIYFKNNHIAIDCGSVFGGRLGVICLDTFETFYVR